MYRWVLLDADGTLLDYDRAESQALAATCEVVGIAYDEALRARYQSINVGLFEEMERGAVSAEALKTLRFERLFAETGVTADTEAFSREYLGQLARGAALLPGALETVTTLHGRVELALITNGLAEVQQKRIGCCGIGRYFSHVIISDLVGAAKPAPAIFDYAFSQMGNPKRAEVLMVGDSLTSDIRGGIDYGIDTCWFNKKGTPRDPDCLPVYEISELRELAGIVRDRP